MKRSLASRRYGFTLIELILAGAIAALVLVTVVVTLSQIGRARSVSRGRLLSNLRATTALEEIRRDLSSLIRDADLFNARILLFSDTATVTVDDRRMDVPRDEILVFNTRLEPLGEIDYNGEGGEYETQYRVDIDQFGAALWQRRDPVPDEFPDGGGIATPIAEGLIGLEILAYDGQEWFDEWDSDIDGYPWGFQITVTAIGTEEGGLEDIDGRMMTTLRTHVSVDRIIPPYVEPLEPDPEDVENLELPEEEGNPGVFAPNGSPDPQAGAPPGSRGGPGGVRAPRGEGGRQSGGFGGKRNNGPSIQGGNQGGRGPSSRPVGPGRGSKASSSAGGTIRIDD